MKREIPSPDSPEYGKLVQQVSLRLQSSQSWYSGFRDEWDRCYERWHRYPARPKVVNDSDTYEVRLGYTFGLIEQLNSKVTEPMLQMGIPFGVFPTEWGDQPKADNFSDMCRDFYSKPNVQEGKRKSKKEMIICGPRIEIDEWLHIVEPGQKWGEKEEIIEQAIVDPKTGEPVLGEDGKPAKAKMVQKVMAEVDQDITTFYGFNTVYPRNVDFYPEPDRTTIDTGQKTDMSWFCWDMGELALEDMAREMIYNPDAVDPKTGKRGCTVPRYDFSKLIKDSGDRAQKRYAKILEGAGAGLVDDNFGPLITPIHDWSDASTTRHGNMDTKHNDAVANQSFEDRDKIWVCQMRTKNEIRTIAQGKYIIERVLNPWHRPRLGARVENYTSDPRSLFGPGAITPIFDELDSLDITDSLMMQNFFREVNTMLLVKIKALDNPDDLDRRAGGVVRVNDEVESLGQAVMPVPRQNVMSESLGAESNIKGNIEFVSSNLDASPGIHGTRQNHKTAKGMQIIESNIGTRFVTMQSSALINEARCGESMLYFTEQFHFDKVSYRCIRDDGSTVYAKFNKEDVDTNGRGFRFLITVDPLWGNTQAQRSDALELLDMGYKHEEYRLKANDPKIKRANVSELFEDALKKFGRRDVSGIFEYASGEISPDVELQILMQGGVPKPCQGDLMSHIQTHILQAQSPNLKQAIEAGKAHQDTIKNLMLIVQEDMARLATFMKDPAGAASKKLNEVGMKSPAGPSQP